jgi:hypothetical protein
MRWYRFGDYCVLAASREAAAYYLRRCLADRRPYEPGRYIKTVLCTR